MGFPRTVVEIKVCVRIHSDNSHERPTNTREPGMRTKEIDAS